MANNDISPYAPLIIEGYIVRREPLRGTPHTRYCILVNGTIACTQISYPDADDCRRAKWHTERANRVAALISKPEFDKSGTLGEQIVRALAEGKMGLQRLAGIVGEPANNLSPILTRLIRKGHITRRGGRRNVVYELA